MENFELSTYFFSIVSFIGFFFLVIGWVINQFTGGELIDDYTNLDTDDLPSLSDSGESFANIDDAINGYLHNIDLDDDALPFPSFFSIKIFRIVLLVFGLGGNIGLHLFHFDFLSSLFLAILSGFFSGFIVYIGLRFIYRQTTYSFRDPIVIGRQAKVILEIPAQGLGKIVFEIVGQKMLYAARSHNNEIVKSGTNVEITQKIKGVCIVRPKIQ